VSLASLIVRIGADLADYDRKLVAAERRIQSFASNVASAGTALTAAITVPLAGVGVAALKVAGELEQNKIAFETMLGSAAKAQKHLEDLKNFAARTPFEFSDLTVASKRLQALGFDASRVIPILTSVGNAASALGMGAEGIQRITTALGQMQAKGKVQAEEMRQLAEAGIPAWQILAKTLNTDVAGAMKLVEQRAVDAGTAVPAILEGMNSKFGGLMDKQSKSLLGMWSNFKDQVTFTLQDIGTAIQPAAKQFLNDYAMPMINGAKDAANAFSKLTPAAQGAILKVSGAAMALPVVILAFGTLAEKAMAAATAITKMGGAAALLKGAGWAGIALSIGELAGGMWHLATGQDEARAASKNFMLAQEQLYSRLVMMGKGGAAQQLREQFMNGSISADAYSRALLGLANRFAPVVAQVETATPKMGGFQGKVEDTEKALRLFGVSAKDSTDELAKAWPTVEAAFAARRITLEEYSKAIGRYREASGEAEKTLNAFQIASDITREAQGRLNGAYQSVIKTMFDYYQAGTTMGRSLELQKVAIDDTALRTQLLTAEIERLGAITAKVADADFSKLRGGVLATQDAMNKLGVQSQTQLRAAANAAGDLYQRVVELKAAGQATALDVARAYEKWTEAERKAGQVGGEVAKQQKKALQEVSTVITNMSQDIARMIVNWESAGKTFIGIAKRMGESILSNIIEHILTATGLVTKLTGLLSKIPLIGGIFGAGASAAGSVAGGVGSATGGVAGAVGSVSGGASGAAGAASSGIMGAINLATGIGSLVSGVVGNFQMSGMNKSLDVLVQHTLQTTNIVRDTLNTANTWWPYLKSNNEALWVIRDTLMDPVAAVLERIDAKLAAGRELRIYIGSQEVARAVLPAAVRELKLAGA